MHRRRPSLGLALLAFVGATSAQETADWPHFGGAGGDARTAPLASEFAWGEDGPEVLWRTPTGPGYGGPAIRDGQVFLLDREVGVRDRLRVIDLVTGKEEWEVSYEAPGRLQFAGSRTVPAITAEMVLCVGGQGRVTGIDRKKRAIAWDTHLEEVYGGELPMFGWSCSPLIVGDMVIVTILGEEAGLLALDVATGEERWVTETVGYSHSTPVLMDLLGKRQIVFLSTMYQTSGVDQSAPTTISSFDPEFGELLWRTETELTRLPIPPPVRIDDQRFFVTGGYRGGSTMLRIAQTEEGYAFEELFHLERGAQVHAPILFEDHLYLIVNENWNDQRSRRGEGGLMCLSLEGKELWRTKDDPYLGRGNLFLAGDALIVQDGYDGTLRVVPATPKGYSTLAQARPFGPGDGRDQEMWAPMATANGLVVMRSQDELICLRP